MQCTEVCIVAVSVGQSTVRKVYAVDIHRLLSDSLVCMRVCVCVCVCSNNHITLCSYKTICIALISGSIL